MVVHNFNSSNQETEAGGWMDIYEYKVNQAYRVSLG